MQTLLSETQQESAFFNRLSFGLTSNEALQLLDFLKVHQQTFKAMQLVAEAQGEVKKEKAV